MAAGTYKVSKKETADSEKIIKLIGKPTPDTRITKTNNPAIIKLLKHFKYNTKKVYRFYDLLVSLGWVDNSYSCYCVNVCQNLKRLNVPTPKSAKVDDEVVPVDTGDSEIMEMAEAAANYDEGELISLRKDLASTKRKLKDMQASDYERRVLIESLREELTDCRPDRITIKFEPVQRKVKGKFYNILPISDIHWGETVKPQDVNNLNKYDFEISRRRHIELFKKNYEFSKTFGCDELDIFMLGDIFSGNIHDELRENNEAPITKCIVEYFKFITGLIDAYKDCYDHVRIHCVVGNHARTTQKYQFKRKGIENYEYILYAFLEDRYNNSSDNVTVNFGESTILFATVGEQTWKLEHGDRYKGGSAFVSPLSTTVRDNFKDQGMFETSGQRFDAVMMGHWHVGGEWFLPGTSTPIYMNPSLIGPGEYAVNNCHSGFPASSYCFITDGHEVVDKRLINLSSIR